MGRNMLRLLKFLIKYPSWTTYGHDRSTVDAIRRLRNLGLVETNEYRQVRLATPFTRLEIIDG